MRWRLSWTSSPSAGCCSQALPARARPPSGASLPPALVRSGRIELWLETRLPDESARLSILQQRFAGLPASIGKVDLESLATETDGLTGADLKRLVDDGKILYAYDRSRGLPL